MAAFADQLVALARRFVHAADLRIAAENGWTGLGDPFELAACIIQAMPAVRATGNTGLVDRMEKALGGLDNLPTPTTADTPQLRNLPPRLVTVDTRIAKLPVHTADPHYLTPEHRAWRAVVIGRSGGRCQDPACPTPTRTGIRLFADHVHELKDGGAPLDPANGLARCGACHTRKTLAERARRMARPT